MKTTAWILVWPFFVLPLFAHSTTPDYSALSEAVKSAGNPPVTGCQLDSPALKEAKMLKKLKDRGYTVYPFDRMQVIRKNGSTINHGDLSTYHCKTLVSGTFFGRPGNRPVGPFIQVGSLSAPDAKTISRGYTAMLANGTIVINRPRPGNYNYKLEEHRQRSKRILNFHREHIESSHGSMIQELIGGGALLIHNGAPVSHSELKTKQAFDQGSGGINSPQMRTTHHMVIMKFEGKSYAVMTPKVSGKKIRDDMLDAGVEAAVKYDGGSGCRVYTQEGGSRNLCPSKGENPTGICLK